ncbi:MAG: MFS transporter [Gammaproteobacteria bacterium]|nr:MFS transporter [Gammaproteobacteria bacterium]
MHDVRKLLPFYAVIFLGFFGYALTIALFIPMLLDQSFPILPKAASVSVRASVSGFLLAAYPLGQFLGSPIIGRLSDHYGPKKILILSLVVCVVGFSGIALSIQSQSIYFLFFSCFVTGLFESNMAISQSVIADQCQDSIKKTQLIGYAFSACSLGYIIGPLVGGLSASEWGYSCPFWLTAGGILLLMVWIQSAVKEVRVVKSRQALKVIEAVTTFKTIFTVKQLRKVYLINFMIFFAVQGLYRVVPLYVQHQWAPNLQTFTTLISFVSFLCLMANIFMMGRLASRFPTQQLLAYLLIFSGITAIMVVIPSHYSWIWFVYGLMVLPTVLLLTTCTTWLSNQVANEQQGQVLGNNQALLVLGESLSAAVGGLIAAIAVPLPIIVMGGILLIAYWVLKRR